MAEVLKISTGNRSRRDWEFARAWLHTGFAQCGLSELDSLLPSDSGSNMTPARLETIEELFREAPNQEPNHVKRTWTRLRKGDEAFAS